MAEMAAPPPASPIVVLMVEDSLLDRDQAVARLEGSGFVLDVHHATGREEFVAVLDARRYDLVLADFDVPGFHGMEALDLVRAHDPLVPFIFVSGEVGEEVAIDSLHRGATDYVLKQRLDRLGPAVRRALREAKEHTTRLRAEAAARSSDERFRQLTNTLTQLVWTLDADGNLNYTNPAWRRVVHQDTLHWCDQRVLHPDDLPACEAAWAHARHHSEGFSLEARMRHHETGEYRWYLVRVVPLSVEGDAPAWLCTAIDVQDQRVREEALRTAEKLAVTGRMAATIAHEINNPLESLTNLVFLLKEDRTLSGGARRYVNMADYELQRVSAIAKQTLAFYRDSSTPTAIDLRDLLDDVMRLFGPRFRTKSMAIEMAIDQGSSVFATRGDLRQVLINLISNAIDAVPTSGTIRVIAHALPGSQPVQTILIVEDSGSGILPQNAAQLFTPFFSTKGEHGTGLGLWVSKGIVEKHHGSIAIQSHPQPDGSNRTQVQITLPRDPISHAPEGATQPTSIAV